MSTAADRAAATAAKFARSAKAAPGPDEPRPDDDPVVPAARSGKRPPRTEPVRSTVDLAPGRHHWLDEWQADTAWQLGTKVRHVSRQAVLDELVAELQSSATLQRILAERLAERVRG